MTASVGHRSSNASFQQVENTPNFDRNGIPSKPKMQKSSSDMRDSGSVSKLAAVAGSVLLPVIGNIVFSSVSKVLGAKETFLDIAKTFYSKFKEDSDGKSYFGRLGAAWKKTVEEHGASTVYGHAGGLAGSFAGFLIGLAAPPFGWMVGSLIGAALGTLLGNVLAERAEKKHGSTHNTDEPSSSSNIEEMDSNQNNVVESSKSASGGAAGDQPCINVTLSPLF